MSVQNKDAQLQIGNWRLEDVPAGWEFVPQTGLFRREAKSFPSSVSFVEEPLPEGQELESYVQSQLIVARHYMPEIEVIGPQPSSFPETDEALKLLIRHKTDNGNNLIQGQIYVRCGKAVGILTCTTIQEQLTEVQPAFDLICKSSRFRCTPSDSSSVVSGSLVDRL